MASLGILQQLNQLYLTSEKNMKEGQYNTQSTYFWSTNFMQALQHIPEYIITLIRLKKSKSFSITKEYTFKILPKLNTNNQSQTKTLTTTSVVKEEVQNAITQFRLKNQNRSDQRTGQIKKNKGKVYKQKQGRNANSNLLKIFFRSLYSRISSIKCLVHTIIYRHNMKITTQDFMRWLQNHKVSCRQYIKVQDIRKIFINEQTTQNHKFQKIMRILLSQFLEKQVVLYLGTSRKIAKKTMRQNLQTSRMLLFQLLRQR